MDYIRSVAEARAYYPLTKDFTLVGRAIGGNIQGWNGQDVRIVDDFYKGGETIRGFATAGLGPRDLATGEPMAAKTSMLAQQRFASRCLSYRMTSALAAHCSRMPVRCTAATPKVRH